MFISKPLVGLGIFLFIISSISLINNAYADPFFEHYSGYDYDRQFLGTDSSGSYVYKWSSSQPKILDAGEYKNYILEETATEIKLQTNSAGSLVFNKNSCSYDLYSPGYLDGQTTKLKNISWTVKGKLNSSSTWSSVNNVNNAACSTTIQSDSQSVKITATKSGTLGKFQIVLDYFPGHGIKETMRAYNDNVSWSNHNIGFTETFQVPTTISFGGTSYDLSNYNNTVLDRNWIESNQAKLIKLTNKINYDFGLGFSNLNDIKITWDGTNAKLSLNYLYPTQIVPYQTWVEVDPTFTGTETSSGRVQAAPVTASNCAGSTFSASSSTTLSTQKDPSICSYAWADFTISSISPGVIVTSSSLEYDVVNLDGTTITESCYLVDLPTQGSGSSTTYNEASAAATKISGSFTSCQSLGNGKTVTLNGTGRAKIQENIDASSGFYSLAWVMATQTINDASNHRFDVRDNDAVLSITYAIPQPNSPTSLSATSLLTQTQYHWVQTNGTGTSYYLIGRSLDNVTWPQSQKINAGNVTTYLDTHPYCSAGNTCYVNVTASNPLRNSTSSSYASYVMDYPPDAVDDLSVSGITDTSITISFSAPNFHGHSLIGYQVNYTTPYGTPNTIYINTTNTVPYTITGLTSFTPYSIRVGAITDGGRNATGNIVDSITLYPAPTFPITWNSISNPILIDSDDDGTIDTVYSANTTSSNKISFTKMFGTGLSTISKSFSVTFGTSTTAYFGVLDKNNFIVSFGGIAPNPTTCSATLNFVNINTGAVQTPITITRAGGGGGSQEHCFLSIPRVMQRSNNTYVSWGYTMHNSVFSYNIYKNGTNQSVASTGSTPAIITPLGSSESGGSIVYLPDLTTQSGSLNGTYGIIYEDSATNEIHNFAMGDYFPSIDLNATQWNIGLKKTYQLAILTLDDPQWAETFGSLIQNDIPEDEEIFYLNYKILLSSLSSEPVKTKISISGEDHIGLLTSNTLYVSRIPDISSYDFSAWLLDTYSPTIYSQDVTTALPSYSISVIGPTLDTDIAGTGIQGFITDYRMEVPGVDRQFYPEILLTSEVQPAIIPPSTGLTAVSVNVRNAPQDGVVKITNPTFSFLGVPYQWTVKSLLADNTYSIDLPTNSCFDTWVSPDSTPRIWEDLGTLCASGTMPKQITYLPGLAFTFWTLDWGASSEYDDTTTGLETFVRNSQSNYTYNIRVYDRNGTLSLQQQYTGQNGLSVNSFNITGIQRPATLQILDENNNTIYHATMGNGNWLTDFQAFSNQHLTIDGFNLVAMMPLIFAAMWTRNTISMGTMMTVVMIATLGFFGVLAIPEIVLYLMLFIAAIGMVAYKLLY